MDTKHKAVASEFIDHGSETYSFLADPVVDALVQIVLELGAETWITRRRLLVLERVLASRNVLASCDVETYVPTDDDRETWRLERDRLLRSVYSALGRRPQKGNAAAEKAKRADAPKASPRTATPRIRAASPGGP